MRFNFHSITAKSLGAFFIATLLFLAALLYALSGMKEISHVFETRQAAATARLEALNTMFGNGLFGGIATRNKVFKPKLVGPRKVVPQSAKAFAAAMAQARRMTGSDDTQSLKLLDEIGTLWQTVQSTRLKVLDLAEAGNSDEAIHQLAQVEHPAWRQIRKDLQVLMKDQKRREARISQEANRIAREDTRTSLLIGLAALIIGALIMIFVMRSITRGLHRTIGTLDAIAQGEGDLTRRLEVRGRDEIALLSDAFNRFVGKIQTLVKSVVDSTAQVATAAEEMSAITAQSKSGVDRQQREIDMVATAINEMSATVQEIARNTADAASAAQHADTQSQEGKMTVEQARRRVNELAGEVNTAGEAIGELAHQSEEIGAVLDVIRGISEQTNLLALNAAIEAARAGEHGRGFAVVADEVRTLASRAQDSTQTIQEIVERLQAHARHSAGVMRKSNEKVQQTVSEASATGESLASITRSVGAISDMNTQIASAAEEQSAVAEELSANINNIKTIADDAALNAEHLAGASDSMARLASELKSLTGSFKV